MACTCGHSPVLLPSNNVSMNARSSLSSTLRARQSKLDVRIAGSQQLGRDYTLLKLGARRCSVAKLSISRRVNLTTCSAVRGEGETTILPDESGMQLMDVVGKRVQPYLKLARFRWSLAGPWPLVASPVTWPFAAFSCAVATVVNKGAAFATKIGTLPDWRIFTVLVVASVILRSAGCTVNDLWDKDFDGKVERSKLRPLVSGEVTPFQGWVFLELKFFLCGCTISTRGFQTPAVLGLVMNWSVFLGWSAVRGPMAPGPLALPPALVFFAAWCWTLVYETIYAHQDIKDDQDAGVKSLPLLLGDSSKLWLTGFGTAFVASLGIAGHIAVLGWPFYVGVAATAIHVGWQIATVDLKNPNDCLAKFLSNKWVGMFVFGGIVGAKLLA